MKKTIISLFLCLFFVATASASEKWQKDFYNSILTDGYEIAMAKAIGSGVPAGEICAMSAKLGYPPHYVLVSLYAAAAKQNLNADNILAGMAKTDFAKGVDMAAVASDAKAGGATSKSGKSGDQAPGVNELKLNYARYYGDPELGAPEEENQGLGFGDNPELGAGDVSMGQVGFSSGGNIGVPVSPSAP